MCVAVNTVETPFIHVNKWCSVCPYHVVSAPEERNKCFWICSVLLTAGNDFRVLWCADATKQMKFKLTEDVSRLKTQQRFREFKSTLEGLFYLYIYKYILIDWLIDWISGVFRFRWCFCVPCLKACIPSVCDFGLLSDWQVPVTDGQRRWSRRVTDRACVLVILLVLTSLSPAVGLLRIHLYLISAVKSIRWFKVPKWFR